MFDLKYYNELIEMITLENEQEDYLNFIYQKRLPKYVRHELMTTDAQYMRFRYLQEKHLKYFSWYFNNFILQNRTRQERFSMISPHMHGISRRRMERLYQ